MLLVFYDRRQIRTNIQERVKRKSLVASFSPCCINSVDHYLPKMILHLFCFLIASSYICQFDAVVASTTSTEINLTGVYKWTIVTVIDNSMGKEYVTQQAIEIKSECDIDITVEELRRQLLSSSSQNKATINGLRYVTGSNGREYSHHEELMNKMFAAQTNNDQDKAPETIQMEITVPAGEIVVLYQLHFTAPGISLSFPITTTNLKEVEIPLKFEVETTTKPVLIANGSIFALQSFHGTYLSAGYDSQVRQVRSIQEKEKWTFVHVQDDVYELWSFHGMYLRAHKGGEGSKVDLHKWGLMDRGRWTAVITPSGKLALRSMYGTYLRAHQEMKGIDLQVDKQDWDEMGWEQFHLVPVTNEEDEL